MNVEILPTLTEIIVNGETYFKSETVNIIIDRLHLAITDYKKISVEYKVHNRIMAERLATAEADNAALRDLLGRSGLIAPNPTTPVQFPVDVLNKLADWIYLADYPSTALTQRLAGMEEALKTITHGWDAKLRQMLEDRCGLPEDQRIGAAVALCWVEQKAKQALEGKEASHG